MFEQMRREVANTPSFVRTALFVNTLLVVVALVFPRMLASSHSDSGEAEGATILFALPMGLIFAIGACAAIRAYILARREDRELSWTAFVPLGIFLAGMLTTLVLIYTQNII